MGLFDEFTDFMNDMKEIKKDMVTLGMNVVNELKTEADGVKDTVTDTAEELKSQAEEVKQTIVDSATSLESQMTQTVSLETTQHSATDDTSTIATDDAADTTKSD